MAIPPPQPGLVISYSFLWKFIYRGIPLDWARQTPVDDAAYTHFAAGSPPGQPDETDRSYARLSLFMRGVL